MQQLACGTESPPANLARSTAGRVGHRGRAWARPHAAVREGMRPIIPRAPRTNAAPCRLKMRRPTGVVPVRRLDSVSARGHDYARIRHNYADTPQRNDSEIVTEARVAPT